MRPPLVLLASLSAACVTNTVSPKDDDTTSMRDCDVSVVTTSPTEGATDVSYRSPVVFTLSAPDDSAVVISDYAGTLAVSEDGLTLTWTSDAPLPPDTDITVTLSTCAGDEVVHLHTSTLGMPVEDGLLIDGAFAIDLVHARIRAPEGLGDVIVQLWKEDVLVGVRGIGGGTLDLVGAVGTDDADPVQQNYCNPTIDLTGDYRAAPYFSVGPVDTTLPFDRGEATIEGMYLTGTFTAEGRSFQDGTFGGTVDTRPLSWILNASDDPGAICTLAAALGVACEPCAADGAPYCLTLVAEDVTGTRIATGPIVVIDTADCRGCRNWTAATVPAIEERVCPP